MHADRNDITINQLKIISLSQIQFDQNYRNWKLAILNVASRNKNEITKKGGKINIRLAKRTK